MKNLKHFTGQKGTSVSSNVINGVLLDKNLDQLKVGAKLLELMKVLEGVDENNKLAKLNETTISDNNGGRIEL